MLHILAGWGPTIAEQSGYLISFMVSGLFLSISFLYVFLKERKRQNKDESRVIHMTLLGAIIFLVAFGLFFITYFVTAILPAA
jgi:hypothetical protein